MATFRFVHAADIHLDSPMAGLLARDDLPAEVIRHSTRRAFAAMVQLSIDEDAAFVVIAGDLYDRDWRDYSTGLFFAEQMRRLNRPCFLLRGNHDAHSLITRDLTLPAHVREFSSRACQSFELADFRVVLSGHSFPKRDVSEDLSVAYPAPRHGWLNIGVLHTSGDDPGEHAVYAPCTAAALALKGYDYWALGHIHQRRELSVRPWIVFPGNLQGRHPGETGPKGCTLVTVEDGRIVAAEHRTVDVLRWAALEIDVTGRDVASITGQIENAVGAALAAADERPVLARLTLTGETGLHGRLLGDTERLAAECRVAAMAAAGNLWIERVRVRTRPVRAFDLETLTPLRSAFLAGLDDPVVLDQLLRDLGELRGKLPAEARDLVDLPDDPDALRALADDAWAIASDMLAEGDAA